MVDVPPPPENPFMQEPVEPGGYENGNGNGDGLDQGRPNVAAKPGRVLIVLAVVGAVLLLLLYNIFSGGKKAAAPVEEKPRKVAAAVEPPPLPVETPVLTPPPVMITPTIPAPTALPTIRPEDDAAAKKQVIERMHSKMMLADGGGGSSTLGKLLDSGDKKEKKPATSDPNSAFEANTINATTEAEHVEATRIGDLTRTIAQGRIIQATMESALNTDLPAPIRAVVSRDTYAEAGTEPLIPKGSRLIGTYNTDISGGQSRVFVIWTRVIRPDGVDIQLGSPLVDQIGMAGVGGQVDTKFQSIFSRSILSSIVGIALAIGTDKISDGSTTTTSSALGGSQTTGDASTTATVNALNRLGSVSDSFIQRFLDTRPTILVDQGSEVNVFVNRDLIFPAKFGHSTQIVN